MTNRLRSLAPLLTTLVLVAGCGSDAGDGERASASTDVNALLRSTFTNLGKMESATVDLKVRVEPRGAAAAQGAVGARLQGPFASQGAGKLPKFAFAATLESGGQTFSAGVTWTGKQAYVALQGTPYEVSGLVSGQFVAGYEEALKSKQGSAGGLVLGGLGIDFTQWLRDARNEGVTNVGDTETIKISGSADVDRVIADLSKITERAATLPGASGRVPQKLTPEQKRAAATAIKALNVTVYTGAKDRILRRLTVTADLKDAASKIDAGLLLDLTFTKVGEEQSIEAPADPQPFSELLKAVDAAGLANLGLTGGGSGEAGEEPATGGTPNNVDKYAACIEKAGGDRAKARECAALLAG
jgi:hypothetical protein